MENTQGYHDQIIFAFETYHPSLSLVAEGSVLEAFRWESILMSKRISNGRKPVSA
ncbi:DUF6334 family protein [Myxacorys almedinensis]|uniref:DUF6334 family protein n=1 Tax=Myxacorys almedinensis TaxID=2651157 RepID=UPI003B75BC34